MKHSENMTRSISQTVEARRWHPFLMKKTYDQSSFSVHPEPFLFHVKTGSCDADDGSVASSTCSDDHSLSSTIVEQRQDFLGNIDDSPLESSERIPFSPLETESIGPVEPPLAKIRPSLTFNKDVTVIVVEPVASLTDKRKLWFQRDEIIRIRERIHSIVDKTNKGQEQLTPNTKKTKEVKKHCVRGLERFLDSYQFSENRLFARYVVLNEIYSGDEAIFDPQEALAQRYRSASRRCEEDAIERAAKDQEEVEQYLLSLRRLCKRLSL